MNPIKNDVQTLFTILENFGEATGLYLNLEKSVQWPPSDALIWT
jgi:hypothetical protein